MARRRRPTSERTETIALDLYLVEGVAWAGLSDGHAERLRNALRSSRWRGATPERFGFTGADVEYAAVYGYFSQEFPDVVRQYDDQKTPTETIQPNFVDLLYILDTATGYLLLQDRRFHNEAELSMPQSRERFASALASVTRRVRMGSAVLTPKEYLPVSKEQFLSVIRREEVWELEVDHLEGRSIPDGVAIFNPDVDAEQLYREVWTNHERENLSQIRMKRAPNGNLGKSKVARAAANAGDPRRVVYGQGTGPSRSRRRVLVRAKKTHMGGVTVHRPISEDDVARVLRILADLLEGTDNEAQRATPGAQQLALTLEEDDE